MTLPGKDLSPQREVVRAVEAVSGSVPMRWRLTPRFGFGMRSTRIGLRAGVPVATHGADAMAICSWDAREPRIGEGSISGYFDVTAGGRALFALSVSHQEPLIIPSRTNVESRLATTGAEWRKWSDNLRYGTEWRDAVVRDALVLKLLVHAPSGAIAAAATTSLPEEIGGARNWDYRFCWVRDSAFVLNALLRLGCVEEGREPIWANGIAAPFGEISTIVDPVPWVLAWSLKLLTSVSPCTKAPMVVGTTAIPYGFTSPLLGTVEPTWVGLPRVARNPAGAAFWTGVVEEHADNPAATARPRAKTTNVLPTGGRLRAIRSLLGEPGPDGASDMDTAIPGETFTERRRNIDCQHTMI